ncbi:NACHT domain-containing protein [Trichoderma pleuroticola]
MKSQLERLEKKWGMVDSSTPMIEVEEEEEKPDADSLIYLDSHYAFLHMKVYIKFIDETVMPLFQQFSALPNNYPKVTFADLWYLFREGELLYSPVPKQRKRVTDNGYTTNNLTLQGSYQNLSRVYSIVTPEVADELDDKEDDSKKDDDSDKIIGSDDDSHEDTKTFRIWSYCIDFDGESYGPVQRHFHITKFEGERDIRSLAVYPVKFVNDYEKLLKTQQESGELFKKYIERKHLYHSGWTLTCSTTGAPLDEIEKYPEHIDGQVIVDFSEAYQTITSWKPEFHNPDISAAGELGFKSCGEFNFEVRRYASNRKASNHICISLHRFDDIGIKRRNEFISNDGFLSAVKRGDDKEVIQALNGDSLVVLPKRLVVFSLMQRKFVHVNISCLKTIEGANVFNLLSINPRHKQMVRSLVQEHFRKKKQQHLGQEVQYQDLIKGKGTGLVFLLHGVPGVGKTATAEAVALENRKPLFAITCGDLGFEPISLEKNLGLFLRILEYYSGVLFLTTNRVGIIDEAFKSRVHMSLYYPELSKEQYRNIFELNIKRVQQIEAENEKMGESSLSVDAESILKWCERHFESTNDEVGRWNGRQIKNAFQIGASLAHYDSATTSSKDAQKPYPRDDKARIEQSKGYLLRGSYQWVLENAAYKQWRRSENTQMLWIKASEHSTNQQPGVLVSYFFCEAADARSNDATSVLRGLIYLLADKQPSLIKRIQKKYDHAGKALFEDTNAWFAVSGILTEMLQDLQSKDTYLIIDALDECAPGDLPKLLSFIQASSSSRVKWIISSRNQPEIERRMRSNQHLITLSLEQNAEHVSRTRPLKQKSGI